jgi:hypothetical protein
MTDYPAGTVAVATVRGVPNVRIFRSQGDWISGDTVEGAFWADDRDVTDISPLVMLDIADMRGKMVAAPSVNELPTWLRTLADANSHGKDALGSQAARLLADQIEAQTRPPRIPQPGLWGVVEAGCDGLGRRTWLHVNENPAGNDWASTDGWHRVWADLEDPALVRDGIEETS